MRAVTMTSNERVEIDRPAPSSPLASGARRTHRRPTPARWDERVPYVCNTDARYHRRVAKDGRRADQVVKESNAGAEKHRRDVEVNFVEEAGVEALLDGISAMHPNGLPCGGGCGLLHGAFDAVRHEVDRRVGSRPPGGNVVRHDECRSPRVISAPAFGDVEGASTGDHRTEAGSAARSARCGQ